MLDATTLQAVRAAVAATLRELQNNQPIPATLKSGAAARYVGLSTSKLSRLRREGRLPFIKIGSAVRFLRIDFDHWLQSHKTQA